MFVKSLMIIGCLCLTSIAQAKTVDQSVMNKLMDHESLSVLLKSKPEATRRELICLALNAYHEARSSTLLDQIATTFVAKNRYENQYRGKNICEVVWYWRQFSWTHDGKSDYPKEKKAWANAQRIAFMVYFNDHFGLDDPTNGKMHYVRKDIVRKLKWTRTAKHKQLIGAHVYLIPVGFK